MTTLPLGIHAYKRTAGREPEIRLVNRFVESEPTNQREHIALLSRPGTTLLDDFAGDTSADAPRGLYSLTGLFNDDLFVIVGSKLYREAEDGTQIAIGATIGGTGRPFITWDKGLTYERLFISDGQLLVYYDGGTHATGVLTAASPPTNQLLQIGTTYYSWSLSVDTGPPDGTAAKPFLALLDADPLLSMANLLDFIGTRGVNFSTVISAPNTQVTAVASNPVTPTDPATKLTLTALSENADGNAIATVVTGTAGLSWGAATLTGGGSHIVHGIEVPTGEGISALANLNHFIMCAVTESAKLFYLRPGTVILDALDYATKETNPDPILDLITVGDFTYVMGAGSTEVWYTTGQNDNPIAPNLGRTMARGIIEGTAVNVNEDVLFVGNDGVVYSTNRGPVRISDNAIEERIRKQIRREKGLT